MLQKGFLVLLLISLFTYAIVVPESIVADIYFPQLKDKCTPSEIFFKQGQINPDDYSTARKVEFDSMERQMFNFEEPDKVNSGYCVKKYEYCSINSCILNFSATYLTLFDKVTLPLFHIRNLLTNFIFNSVLILLMFLLARVSIKRFLTIHSVSRILILTILGYIADIVSFWWHFSTKTFATKGIVSSNLILSLFAGFVMVSVLVSIFYYNFYSRYLYRENKRARIISALLFGILSNPVWYYLITH